MDLGADRAAHRPSTEDPCSSSTAILSRAEAAARGRTGTRHKAGSPITRGAPISQSPPAAALPVLKCTRTTFGGPAAAPTGAEHGLYINAPFSTVGYKFPYSGEGGDDAKSYTRHRKSEILIKCSIKQRVYCRRRHKEGAYINTDIRP